MALYYGNGKRLKITLDGQKYKLLYIANSESSIFDTNYSMPKDSSSNYLNAKLLEDETLKDQNYKGD